MGNTQSDTTTATGGPGAALATARQAHGLAVAEVAERLKFAPRQIEALESDRYDLLPGVAISRGMVRGYARLLGIDPDPLVAELESRVDHTPQTVGPIDMHVAIRDTKKGSRLYVVLSLIVLIAVGAVTLEWYVRGQRSAQTAVATPTVVVPTAPVAAPAPVVEPPAVVVPAPEAAAPVDAQAAAEPASGGEAAAVPPAATPTAAPVPTGAAETPAPPPPVATGKVLQLRFSAPAWVEVRDGQGRVLMSRVNTADSETSLDGQPPFSVVIGKASAVALRYAGEPVDLSKYAHADVARFTLD